MEHRGSRACRRDALPAIAVIVVAGYVLIGRQAGANDVRGSVVEDDCQKGAVDLQTVAIVDESETLKLLHEEVDP